MRNIYHIIAFIAFAITFILLITVGVWLVYPYDPLTFHGDKFKILTPVVKQGGSLEMVSDYCKYMDIPATLSKEFVDGILFTTPETTTNREVGCHVITVSTPVPQELPPGVYHLKNIYVYKVNPVREIVITHESENFTVLPK